MRGAGDIEGLLRIDCVPRVFVGAKPGNYAPPQPQPRPASATIAPWTCLILRLPVHS